MPGEWESETENWLTWARTPDFDAYWQYRDAFFDLVLPEPRPGGRTIEIGCGEGRVARDLAARGHAVVGLDTAVGLLVHARDADSAGASFVGGGGEHLPIRSETCDLVVAYNSLQVVSDMAATVSECARVLRPGGHLCFCVAHPVTDLGQWVEGSDPPQFALRQRYFTSERVDDEVDRGGFHMTFRGWTHSLEDYAIALDDAGLLVEVIREPKPAGDRRYRRWRDLPMFMNVRAVKPA